MTEMHILAVAINKGGAGKTMVAKCLATAAAHIGLNVLVLDMDTQQNATQWGRRRKDINPLPVVRFTTENDLPDELDRAARAGCDLVIIDTPPGRSTETPAAVESAHLVIVPFAPEVDHYEGIPRIVRLARTTGKPAVGVLNLAEPNSQWEQATARGVLKGIGLAMAPAVLHRFKVHKEASLKGMTAQELEADSRAAGEITALWNFIYAEVQTCSSAGLQKVGT
jgi:chromosome partitioning protein